MSSFVDKRSDHIAKFCGDQGPVEDARTKHFRDKDAMLGVQIRKLHDMRNEQVAFFDRKMIELQEQEAIINTRSDDLKKKESQLTLKESFVKDLIERLRMEKEEINSIKDLLRTETESVQLQSRDLRRLVSKCEKYLSPITKAS